MSKIYWTYVKDFIGLINTEINKMVMPSSKNIVRTGIFIICYERQFEINLLSYRQKWLMSNGQ